MTGGLIWLPEAAAPGAADGPARRAQKANAAGNQVLGDRFALEKDATQKLLTQLDTLKQSLAKRLLADPGSLTDFRRFNLNQLTTDVDRLITETTATLATQAEGVYANAAQLGVEMIHQPIKATGLTIQAGLPGLDAALVASAFGNTVDLLTPPMQQFATQVKQALRGVAMAGDGRQEAINKLRGQIQGQGFEGAAYRAERIIRTELGRTFNQATYDRMVSLAKEFPFLRKGWRPNKDGRVRKGHREAGQKYARGEGSIPVGVHFAVTAYDERPGKGAKVLGICMLRFPVDPLATPPGRIAAATTIMCRCNAFVDFNLAEFAAFTKQQTQISLGGAVPPKDLAPPTGQAPKPKMPKVTKPQVPKGVKVPTAAQVTPKATVMGPAGKPVTDFLDLNPPRYGKHKALAAGPLKKVQDAYAVLNGVHGVHTDLPKIPVRQTTVREAKSAQAFYARGTMNGKPVTLAYGAKILQNSPMMGVFHETGHYLDHVGIRGVSQVTSMASEASDLMAGWRNAVKGSQAMQTLQNWRNGTGRPLGASDAMMDYLLSGRETFARAYAQYVATKSGNKQALKELRNMQAASTTGAVGFQTKYNRHNLGQAPETDTWDYPWAWSDADFKPIEAAMDSLFEGLGWRKPQ